MGSTEQNYRNHLPLIKRAWSVLNGFWDRHVDLLSKILAKEKKACIARHSWQKVSLILAGFAVCCQCLAQEETQKETRPLTELSLEELMDIVPNVYGASKFEQKSTEAPSSVTVISSDEINRYGYRTLADLLQSVQGVHVSYDRNYSFLGTRGVNLGDFNSRVLVLVDGHQINNNLSDGALIGTAFVLDVDLISRVEIIRGPGSVLYGNNAFFGVINVITKRGGEVGVATSAEYGSFDTYKGRVSVGHKFTNEVEILLSGTLYGSEGEDRLFYKEFNTPDQNRGVARGIDDDDFKSFFGTLSYRDFTLQGAFINREKVNPTAQFGTTFNDGRLRTIDERSYVDLKYNHEFENVGEVLARVHYDRSDFEIDYPSGTNLFVEKQRGEWWGTEVQFNRHLWERHVLTAGAEYRNDFRQSLNDEHRTRESYGVFAQGDFAVLTNLHFNAGVRFDKYGDFDVTTNPRLALIYNPVEKSVFKAIYGTAFRAPNFLELALSPDPDQLDPEEITSYELVYEQKLNRQIRASISGFYNQMDGLIAFQSGGFTNFNADTKGTEFAIEGSWTNGIRARFSYTLQKTESRSLGLDMPDSPEHLIKLNVSVPLWRDKVFAGLEYQYTSQRDSFHNTSEPRTVQGESVRGFSVVNFTLYSRDIVKNLECSASVYNLFDKTYSDPATRFHVQDRIEQNGRTFRVKLTYRF